MGPKDPRNFDNAFIPSGGSSPQQPRSNPKLDRLNALFNKGGGVTAPMPRAVSGGAMESRMRTERLRGAASVEEIAAAADALLKHFQIPDEPELLGKMLVHPDAGVGERALAQLGALRQQGKLEHVSMTMRDALEAFEPRCREPNAKVLIVELLGRKD